MTYMKAGNETRTRDIQLGKLTLYQLSYTRVSESSDSGNLTEGENSRSVSSIPLRSFNWPNWPNCERGALSIAAHSRPRVSPLAS